MSEDKEFQSYERTMKQTPGSRISKRPIPRRCKECEYHQPKWKYDVASKGHFELIRVGRHNRATKVSFDKWYQSQSRYRLVAEDGAERS